MDNIGLIMFGLYILFFSISAIIIVYLVINRIKEKGNEDFEQRDN